MNGGFVLRSPLLCNVMNIFSESRWLHKPIEKKKNLVRQYFGLLGFFVTTLFMPHAQMVIDGALNFSFTLQWNVMQSLILEDKKRSGLCGKQEETCGFYMAQVWGAPGGMLVQD